MNPALSAIQKRRKALQTSFTEQDGRIIIGQHQDCTPIAEWTKAKHNAGEFGSSEMRHAARIPEVILNKYMNEHNVSYQDLMRDPVHMRRIVNDPDNAMFRIWPGKI